MEKPTLHEIAAMPYSETIKAMREHYDPLYGFPMGDGAKQKYTVEVRYSYVCTDWETVDVEASDEAEAIDLAGDEVYRMCKGLGDDLDVVDATVKKIAPAEAAS